VRAGFASFDDGSLDATITDLDVMRLARGERVSASTKSPCVSLWRPSRLDGSLGQKS